VLIVEADHKRSALSSLDNLHIIAINYRGRIMREKERVRDGKVA
jgi:hypothetical protein